jgi:uncharacterized protein YegP (UPF0339 family)
MYRKTIVSLCSPYILLLSYFLRNSGFEIRVSCCKGYSMSGLYELGKSMSGQFYFHLKADNNETILSSHMYLSRRAAKNGIDAVRLNAPIEKRYKRWTSPAGQHFFFLKAENNKVIGRSEMYSTSSAMENGIAFVKANGPESSINDLT